MASILVLVMVHLQLRFLRAKTLKFKLDVILPMGFLLWAKSPNLLFSSPMSLYIASVRNPLLASISNHIDGYPTPVNLSYL
jgi:hypothetical protein